MNLILILCALTWVSFEAELHLPDLPYGYDDLIPHLGKQTLEIHHKKHHAKYVDVANQMLIGTAMENINGDTLLRAAYISGNVPLFNNVAQAVNHDFYWRSMKPGGGGMPTGTLLELIDRSFGSFDLFVESFRNASLTQFGSGWAWLVHTHTHELGSHLKVMKTSNAGNPLTENVIPLLCIDVWEHAYYLDYQNLRPNYVDIFLKHLVNWDFASSNLPLESEVCSAIGGEAVVGEDLRQSETSNVLVIGIAGGSGSGKTTFSKAVLKALGEHGGKALYITHDDYYRDLSHMPESDRGSVNFDHPDALETSLLIEHIKMLKQRQAVDIPKYDFNLHVRNQSVQHMEPCNLVLVEGILIFEDIDLFEMLDIKVFIRTDDDIRLVRRLQRDIEERGRSMQSVLDQHINFVRPMHVKYVEPTMMKADIVVPEGANQVAVDMVVQKLVASAALEQKK